MISNIHNEALVFCQTLLSNSICSNYQFHNLGHTKEVHKNVLLIADEENITSNEKEILAISALFHDTGYSEIYKGHEKISMQIAEEFLKNRNFDSDGISSVINCIAATRMPHEPHNILEKIICDADFAHLASTAYLQKIALLRKEWSYFLGMNFLDEEWKTLNINFLSNHHYHTNFGMTIMEKYKLNNLLLLEETLVFEN